MHQRQHLSPSLWRRTIDEIALAPLEPILHVSPIRIKWVGFFTVVGQLFFGWLWLTVFPQPFESMVLRLPVALLGLLLMWDRFSQQPGAKATEWVFGLVMWIELPALFFWMYFYNAHTTMWFASVVAMILVYYQLTDWRLATLGLFCSLAFNSLFINLLAPHSWQWSLVPKEHFVVFSFAWSSALILAISAANLRRERLEHALTTMGIVAHELRTPLATLSLLGDALRGEGAVASAPLQTKRLEDIAGRIYAISRSMNQQIDMQIANANLLHLPPAKELVSAVDVVRLAVAQYPFSNQRERDWVRLDFRSNFDFQGSERLFVQVLLNMLKNAFRALAAHTTPVAHPEICIEIRRGKRFGEIRVRDVGVGIDTHLLRRVFEPFFSTQLGTGHGLGLAFCRSVVVASGGHISVTSTPGLGTTFSISLPVATQTYSAYAEESEE